MSGHDLILDAHRFAEDVLLDMDGLLRERLGGDVAAIKRVQGLQQPHGE